MKGGDTVAEAIGSGGSEGGEVVKGGDTRASARVAEVVRSGGNEVAEVVVAAEMELS